MTTSHADHIVDTCRRMLRDQLVTGTSGNVSVRIGDHLLVTPTGVDYHELRPGQLPMVDLDGTPVRPGLRPTSELPLHLAVYAARPDVTAIVHTHALHATAVSTLTDTVPAVHYMLATSGVTVRVAEYAGYGTAELADGAVNALRDNGSCLLRNHGTVSVGAGLEQAYHRAQALEWTCRLWLTARSAGSPTLLSAEQMAEAARKLRDYGQPG